jgi:hypothetical protein
MECAASGQLSGAGLPRRGQRRDAQDAGRGRPCLAASKDQPRQEPGRYFARLDDVAGVAEVEPQVHL